MRLTRGILAVALIGAAAVTGALAQADPNDVAKGWQDSADLSYVTTSGNSETSTIAFKNALQALTTTVVKAEAARSSNDSMAYDALRAESIAQRRVLRETHDALVADLKEAGALDAAAALPHATWFGQTVARAEALFGPEPV